MLLYYNLQQDDLARHTYGNIGPGTGGQNPPVPPRRERVTEPAQSRVPPVPPRARQTDRGHQVRFIIDNKISTMCCTLTLSLSLSLTLSLSLSLSLFSPLLERVLKEKRIFQRYLMVAL